MPTSHQVANFPLTARGAAQAPLNWWEYGRFFSANTPWLDGPIIYARDLGTTQNSRLRARFPGRQAYVWQADGQLLQPRSGEDIGPVPVLVVMIPPGRSISSVEISGLRVNYPYDVAMPLVRTG